MFDALEQGRAADSVEIGKGLPGKSYMLAGNLSAASQVKSCNKPRIASKSPNRLHTFPRWAVVAQYLAL